MTTVASWFACKLFGPGNGTSQFSFKGDGVLAGWAQWDADWYYRISKFGYRWHAPNQQSPTAFFPGYAMAMRYGGWLIRDNGLAGYLTTVASGLGSAVAFWTWCRGRIGQRATTTALLALLVYPYSYYLYGAMYPTTLFLLAALVAFRAVERDQLLLAGLAGAVASYTRFIGVAVIAGLVVCVLEQRGALRSPGRFGIPTRIDVRALKPTDGLVLLSAGGLIAYVGFLWIEHRNPMLFSQVQLYWEQPPGPATWFKTAFVEHLTSKPFEPFTWGLATQGALAFGSISLVPSVCRRFGWGIGTYSASAMAIAILGTKDFQGLGRYVIAGFPAFAIVGTYLATHPRRLVILAGSALLLLLMTASFAHGRYLA